MDIRNGVESELDPEMDLSRIAILLDSPLPSNASHDQDQHSVTTSPVRQTHSNSSAVPVVTDPSNGRLRGGERCAGPEGVVDQEPLATGFSHAVPKQRIPGSRRSDTGSGSTPKDTDWFWNWNTAPKGGVAVPSGRNVLVSRDASKAQYDEDDTDGRNRSSSSPCPAVELASSASKRLAFSPPPSLSSQTVPGQPESQFPGATTASDGSGKLLSHTSTDTTMEDDVLVSDATLAGVYPPLLSTSVPPTLPIVVAPLSGVPVVHHSTMPSFPVQRQSLDADDASEPTSVPATVFADFARCHQCCALMPDNSKVVIFDAHLLVKKAFYALVQNGVRSAPVWDSVTQTFIGMLTITDFINILRHYYRSPLVQMDELEEHRIQTWRDLAIKRCHEALVSIDPLHSLYDAVRNLIDMKIHRLPVIDPRTGNCLFILTPKRLLQFIYLEFENLQKPAFMLKSIMTLNIGTYNNIATVSQDTALIVILNIFSERRISAVPVVDHNGQVVEVYAKFDVINLAAEKTYNNLDISVKDALKHRAEDSRTVHTCLPSESLQTVIRRIVEKQVHRLIVVDSHNHVIGIISLSDILSFLILQAPALFSGSET